MTTIFPAASLSRDVIRWEDYLSVQTPFELRGGVWFKREDSFAPLGYGSINGAKLRQCIWLFDQRLKRVPDTTGMVSGASVKSPQLSMGTAVARHFGLETVLVVGATQAHTATRHENVGTAAWLGAKFRVLPVAYNPALQKEVAAIRARHPKHLVLEYGITVSESAKEIEAFHRIGSEQVRSLPEQVEELYMPAGSCNSCVSVLYGIARFQPKRLKRVTLLGIGPLRLEWIENRLRAIEEASGLSVRAAFRRDYVHHRGIEAATQQPGADRVLRHFDLHGTKYVSYQDEMPWRHEGIDFHPTYEGKVMRYLHENRGTFRDFWDGNGTSAFWIVGSRPSFNLTRAALAREVPGGAPGMLPLWQETQ